MRLGLAVLAASAMAVMAAPLASAEQRSSASRPSAAQLNTMLESLGVPVRPAGKSQLKVLKRNLTAAKLRPAPARLARALRSSAGPTVSEDMPAPSAQSRSAADCTSWYVATHVALYFPTSSSWWEFYCGYNGFKGGHLADWWDFYFWTGTNQQFYATWTRYHQDGCWYLWSAIDLYTYGPYFC